MIISLEGIEGTGKSTLMKWLKKDLKKYNPLFTKEPGGTNISEKIRDILLDKDHENMTPETEALLYAASRKQLLNDVIMPRHVEGNIIILDRYIHSTFAYQIHGRGLNQDFVKTINDTDDKWKSKGYTNMPNLVILIDISVDESMKRINKRRKKQDRLDSESVEFYTKVRNGYLEMVKQDPNIVIVNGEQSIRKVYKEILKLIENKIKEVVK